MDDHSLETMSPTARQELAVLTEALAKSVTLHRPKASLGGIVGLVGQVPDPQDDEPLVARIVKSFGLARSTPLGADDSFWLTQIADLQAREIDVLTRGDVAETAALLRDPQYTQLFTGFDDLVANSPWTPHFREPYFQEVSRQWIFDCLLCVAEALGTISVEAVETGRHRKPYDVDELLADLDDAVGFRIPFPNIFPGEVGLHTARGIVSFRAVQSFYQGWRIRSLVTDPALARVVEIGGGLGRTAFYASLFGIRRYTLVDLPMTNVSQGYFLGRVLGPDHVRLYGEHNRKGIAIVPPIAFLDGEEKYDLAVNVDSLTEMSASTGRTYWERIKSTIPRLLSINHEGNIFTVRSLITETDGATATRNPYWLRRGYVEEVVEFGASSDRRDVRSIIARALRRIIG